MSSYISQFYSWLFATFDTVGPAYRVDIADLPSLKIKELKKVLREYGVSRDEYKGLLDKTDLVALARSLIEDEALSSANALFRHRAYRITVIALICTVMYIAKDPLASLASGLMNHLLALQYNTTQKLGLIKISYKKMQYLGAISLVLTIILDVLQLWMQVSAMASWVLPSDFTTLRSLLFPFHPSLPVSTDMLMNGKLNKSFGGFGVNIGPMISMTVCGYLKNWLQEYGASRIQKIVLEKERKREKKRVANMNRENGYDGDGGQGVDMSQAEASMNQDKNSTNPVVDDDDIDIDLLAQNLQEIMHKGQQKEAEQQHAASLFATMQRQQQVMAEAMAAEMEKKLQDDEDVFNMLNKDNVAEIDFLVDGDDGWASDSDGSVDGAVKELEAVD